MVSDELLEKLDECIELINLILDPETTQGGIELTLVRAELTAIREELGIWQDPPARDDRIVTRGNRCVDS